MQRIWIIWSNLLHRCTTSLSALSLKKEDPCTRLPKYLKHSRLGQESTVYQSLKSHILLQLSYDTDMSQAKPKRELMNFLFLRTIKFNSLLLVSFNFNQFITWIMKLIRRFIWERKLLNIEYGADPLYHPQYFVTTLVTQ
jgi:hypothetical protein